MKLKIEGARRQLGTALALYLADNDPVAVHCLAGGGCEVIEFYSNKAGAKPFVSHILNENSNLDITKVRRLQRQYWTAFKHATRKYGKGKKAVDKERDDEMLLSRFSDEQNDTALFIGRTDYAGATNTMPIEAQVHQAWYLAKHPGKLHPKFPSEPYAELFPDINTLSRSDQKRRLRQMVDWARTQDAVMGDAKTDQRPLMLPWV